MVYKLIDHSFWSNRSSDPLSRHVTYPWSQDSDPGRGHQKVPRGGRFDFQWIVRNIYIYINYIYIHDTKIRQLMSSRENLTSWSGLIRTSSSFRCCIRRAAIRLGGLPKYGLFSDCIEGRTEEVYILYIILYIYYYYIYNIYIKYILHDAIKRINIFYFIYILAVKREYGKKQN